MNFSRCFWVIIIASLVLGLGDSTANAQPAFTCTLAPVNQVVRAEGVAELMGDLVLNCTGGVPTTAGQPIPLQTVSIELNTTITSKIVGSGNISEMLLLIDDPYPSFNPVPSFGTPSGHAAGQLACLASNDTNCAINSPGPGFGSAGPYNGSPGYYNAFQGVQTSADTITWTGVPIDAPGTAYTRIIRITNIRGNASLLPVSSNSNPTGITATVAISGESNAVTLPYTSGYVGTMIPGLMANGVPTPGSFTQCTAPMSSVAVTAQEGFAYAFKPQNYGQVLSAAAGTYTGPSAANSDQNAPGFNYNTESAFRPDPTIGGSSFVDPNGIVGLATQGTQLQLTIAGLGAGVSVAVPSYIYLGGEYVEGGPVGVAVLVGQSAPAVYLADGSGSTGSPGPNVSLTVTGGTATAIYEIYYANPSVMETATVPVTVSYAPGLAPIGAATATLSIVPLSSNPNASSTDPIPRFTLAETPATLFTIGACAAGPTLTSVSPNGGLAGSAVPVVLTGTNFASGATVNVSNPGITVSNVGFVSPTEITATFTVAANAAAGTANVTVTTAAGTSAAASFTVTTGQPSLISMTPSNITAGSAVSVTLTGSNFSAGDIVSVNNAGVTVSDVIVVSSTEITAMFSVASSAAIGSAIVTVNGGGGLAASYTFNISPAGPAVSFIAPNSASVGSALTVTIGGTGFLPGAKLTAGAGVTLSNVIVLNASEITATFSIAANAPSGPIDIFVSTSAGSSNAVLFTINPPPPPITLSTTSLAFTYIPGNAAPAAQSFAVLSTGGTAAFSVSATTSSGGNWLSATTGTGATPGNVLVSVQNFAALSAGLYQGTATVQPQDNSMPAQKVAVSLNVVGAQPQLSLSATNLNFSVNAGSPAVGGSLQVLNTAGGTLNYSATAGSASWLSIGCGGQGTATANNPGVICLQVNPAGLSPSTYFDTLTVSAAGHQIVAHVTLQVSSSAASILLSSTGMTFTAVAGADSATPASQTVAVLNQGQGTLNWTAQISGSAPWLAISPASGSSQGLGATQPAITITPDPAGLAAGNYYAVLNVTAPDGSVSNSPAAITVLLTVLPAGSQVPPAVSASGLIFSAPANGTAPAAQALNLTNGSAAAAVGYSFATYTQTGQPWLSASPQSGSVPAAESGALSVEVSPSGLAPGTYYGQLRFGFSNSTTENVDVIFLVTPASTAQARPRASATCSQYGIQFDQPVPTDGGTVTAGQPYTLHVKSTCVPSPPTLLDMQIDFSDGTGPLYATYDSGNGDYEATWIPAVAENVSFYAVSNLMSVFSGSAQTQPFNIQVAAPDPSGAPILTGVLNSASYTGANQIAAGSFISIFGAQLASASTSASSVPFPQELGDVQVTLAGAALPLYFAGTNQVNALVPYMPSLSLDSPQSLVVYRNGAPAALTVNLVAYQPGIFSTAANGAGQGAIQNASYKLVDASHPAQAGDTILIYCQGLGPVVNPPAPGAVSAVGSTTVATPSVYIDGLPAQVVYSGLSPGSVQLYQVNAVVPQGIHSGAIDVYLTIIDPGSSAVLTSNIVTIN